MIERYDRKTNNCAHFVSKWYREKLDIEIEVKNEFELSFIRWMRRHFSRVSKPQNHDLVYMINVDGTTHIGVYYNHLVHHNFKPLDGEGSVCKWTLLAVKQYFPEVSFGRWSE